MFSRDARSAVVSLLCSPGKLMAKLVSSQQFVALLLSVLFCVSGKGQSLDKNLEVRLATDNIVVAGARSAGSLLLSNATSDSAAVQVDWSLNLNSGFVDSEVPNSVLGFDHAAHSARSSITIDGKPYGDALVTDGDDLTSFESPWTNGHQEAILDIELDEARTITAMEWFAADANWIWMVDVSSSVDGNAYQPVPELQQFEMHKKWQTHPFPLAKAFLAKHMRFRFYRNDGVMNIVRLPKSVKIYDGADNDRFELPQAGAIIAKGQSTASFDGNTSKSIAMNLAKPIAAGAYLLSWKASMGSKETVGWAHLFVKPGIKYAKNRLAASELIHPMLSSPSLCRSAVLVGFVSKMASGTCPRIDQIIMPMMVLLGLGTSTKTKSTRHTKSST